MNSGQVLPDKLYFRIGEVSDIVGVKPYVLRYWETEFGDIKPTKSKSGQRLYKKRDVELLIYIKELLYAERFTINGAKQRLKDGGKQTAEVVQHVAPVAEIKHIEPVVHGQSEGGVQGELYSAQVTAHHEAEAPKAAAMTGVDKKFLDKIRSDLVWCLGELSAE